MKASNGKRGVSFLGGGGGKRWDLGRMASISSLQHRWVPWGSNHPPKKPIFLIDLRSDRSVYPLKCQTLTFQRSRDHRNSEILKFWPSRDLPP